MKFGEIGIGRIKCLSSTKWVSRRLLVRIWRPLLYQLSYRPTFTLNLQSFCSRPWGGTRSSASPIPPEASDSGHSLSLILRFSSDDLGAPARRYATPQPTVLETATLPIELQAYFFPNVKSYVLIPLEGRYATQNYPCLFYFLMNSVFATEPTVLLQFQLLGILLLTPSICVVSPFTFATGKTNGNYISSSHSLTPSEGIRYNDHFL